MKKLLIIPMLFAGSIVIGQFKKPIGKPIKIENLEVAQYDFPNEMNWYDANKACEKLGNRWRLPTKDELQIVRNKISNFGFYAYWSSTEKNGNLAWGQYIYSGDRFTDSKNRTNGVRAVRAY